MAWSEYSRFVGDVFGAPLAMEGLFAFFVESTFLGLWIFGWDRLKPAVHAFSLFMAVLGSWISAFFILVANSWMQHPVGAEMIDGRPRMTDIGAVLLNPLAWVTFTHVITSAIQVAGGFLVGIAWYKLWRRRKDGIDKVVDGKVVVGESDKGARDKVDFQVWFKSLRLGAVVKPPRLRRYRRVRSHSGTDDDPRAAHEDGCCRSCVPRRHFLLRSDRR